MRKQYCCLLCFFMALGDGCGAKTDISVPTSSQAEVSRADAEYKVIQTDVVRGEQRDYLIRLPERIDAERLRELAIGIRDAESRQFDHEVMLFYVGSSEDDSVYWAQAEFLPELTLTIEGRTPEQWHRIEKLLASDEEREVLGRWDATEYMPKTAIREFVVFKQLDRFWMETIADDMPARRYAFEELALHPDDRGMKFTEVVHSPTPALGYFLINSRTGHLELRDHNGELDIELPVLND